jgi:uncharacterized protein
MLAHPKYKKLIAFLKDLGSVAVAFSGGVDSTFLLAASKEALQDRVLAMTVRAPYIAGWEIDEAVDLCKELGIRHTIIEAAIPEDIKDNPPDRCYLCKKKIFTTLINTAGSNGIPHVLDGTNSDDPSDHRPGLKALEELGVISPLLKTGITKGEVRDFSRQLGLPTWDKPAYACLLTRLPHGVEVKQEELARIERAEKVLMDMGFRAVRVRSHGKLARIETDRRFIVEMVSVDKANEIAAAFRKIGFEFITIDLEGYRTGSFNT